MEHPANSQILHRWCSPSDPLPEDFTRTVTEVSPKALQAEIALHFQDLQTGVYFFKRGKFRFHGQS